MRWGVFIAAPLVACSTYEVVFDGPDATGTDATLEACAFACVDAWTSFDSSMPPPVPCPAWAPVEGTPCTLPQYQDCEYGPKDYFCNEHFVCWAGQWAKEKPVSAFCGTSDVCSAIADGGACHAPGQVCASGDASVCVCSECGGGPPPPPGNNQWWRCFPLGAGCAVDRPNAGTTCDLPDGSTCSYSAGGCCTGVTEKCASGVWLGIETEPCP